VCMRMSYVVFSGSATIIDCLMWHVADCMCCGWKNGTRCSDGLKVLCVLFVPCLVAFGGFHHMHSVCI